MEQITKVHQRFQLNGAQKDRCVEYSDSIGKIEQHGIIQKEITRITEPLSQPMRTLSACFFAAFVLCFPMLTACEPVESANARDKSNEQRDRMEQLQAELVVTKELADSQQQENQALKLQLAESTDRISQLKSGLEKLRQQVSDVRLRQTQVAEEFDNLDAWIGQMLETAATIDSDKPTSPDTNKTMDSDQSTDSN